MNPCNDCGQTAPTLAVSRALFLDLDWTLIRPVSGFGSVEVSALGASVDDFVPKGKSFISKEDFYHETGPKPSDKPVYNKTRIDFVNTFPQGLGDWELMPGMIDALKPFAEAGFLFLIVSNQGGIASGFHTNAEVEAKLVDVLIAVEKGLGLTTDKMIRSDFFYCPSLDKNDPDRKPNPGMILRAAERYNVDLTKSFFVGDLPSDEEAAKRAGVPHYFHVETFLNLSPFVTLGIDA